MTAERVERDSSGEVRVPAGALYGAQTRRAIENFPVSGRRLPPAFLTALARVKSACAEANRDLVPSRMTPDLCRRIQEASAEVAAGRHDGQFPVDLFQTGSGTSTNMNANEVIANLANVASGGTLGVYAPIHPNDHVNMSQSSNDVIPTALHVAALGALDRELLPALAVLGASLERKAVEFDPVVKPGRTHLMDAVPVRLGQEFGGYATQVRKAAEDVARSGKGLEELAIGGTAAGTGLNAPAGFGARVCAALEKALGRPVREARNHFEAQGARDDVVRLSGSLKALACALAKIAEDVRGMGAGPHGGPAELRIPELQPGSSIMPGKVNPVLCETVIQVAAQVIGNDAAIAVGGLGGRFELNAMLPLLAGNLLESITILANAARLFAARCVDGLQADAARAREPLERSPMAATVLGPVVGYDRAAALVKEALARNVSVKSLAIEQGLVTKEEAERLFDFRRLTGPPTL